MLAILFVILHFLVCALLINGALLCLQCTGNKRPRIYLAIFSFVAAAELAYRLYVAYQTGVLATVDEVLPLYVLITGILEILLMYLYPLEVVRPGWLTPKRLFLLFLPWLLVGGVCIVIYPNIRDLSSFSDMMLHIGEFNVWFRLVILFLCFIPYTILLLYIPYKWQQSNVNNKWIYKYAIGIQGIGLLFSAVVLTGSIPVSSIHLLYGMLFFFYVTYQELYLRLTPSSERQTTTPQVATTPIPQSPLWEKLARQMNENKLWRNPDLMLNDLAKSLYTNRTTLSNLIQQQGYSSYSEFINRHRIEAFVSAISNNRSTDMQQLFYEVGFRSKSTALRNFRLYMGCTPSEYIQRIGGSDIQAQDCSKIPPPAKMHLNPLFAILFEKGRLYLRGAFFCEFNPLIVNTRP